MEAMSHAVQDLILDTPFTVGEDALTKLETKKSDSADGMLAKHFNNGGLVLTVWLKRILNSIISLEQIPASLKMGMISKGKD